MLNKTKLTVRDLSLGPNYDATFRWLMRCYSNLESIRDLGGCRGGEEAIARAVRGSLHPSAVPKYNEAWRVVRFDAPKDMYDFREDLRSARMRISVCANDLLRKSACALPAEDVVLYLCRRSVKRFGFDAGASYGQICGRIIRFGFELCPEWLAPALRGQYREQPENERLHVAMRPIIDSAGRMSIFSLVHDEDGLHLLRSNGSPGTMYGPDELFVIVKPRSAEKR